MDNIYCIRFSNIISFSGDVKWDGTQGEFKNY